MLKLSDINFRWFWFLLLDILKFGLGLFFIGFCGSSWVLENKFWLLAIIIGASLGQLLSRVFFPHDTDKNRIFSSSIFSKYSPFWRYAIQFFLVFAISFLLFYFYGDGGVWKLPIPIGALFISLSAIVVLQLEMLANRVIN